MEDNNWFNSNVISFSLLLGFLGWIIKSILDALVLYDKPFFDILLLDVPTSEFLIRFFVCMCFFIFGIFLSKNIYQRKIAEKKLKKANEELSESNEQLEKKVKERTEKIQKLLDQKNELIVQISHDLKTPLTPLMGLLPTVHDKVNDPEIKELIEISLKNIHYIRDMVSKTIDIARLDSGLSEFDFENTNLLSEVDKVISNNQCILDNNDIIAENNISEKIIVKADKLRLREVLNNLISNSVKYNSSDRGGMISFNASEKDDFIIISVKDTGLGLKKKDIDKIFDDMYKADPSRHDLGSNGLGLSICKRIIERHGGKIWAESPGEGKGTTIFFSVPISD